MTDDDEDQAPRPSQVARHQRRDEAALAARIAMTVMKLGDAAVARLRIDDELREVIVRARRITSHIARRRAERSLAGELRRYELGELEEQLANADATSTADARRFQLAEQWREKLITDGIAAAETLPGGADDELARMIAAARRERETGKPPGAARALFRAIAGRLGP